MRPIPCVTAAALVASVVVSPAFAQSTGMKNGSNDASTTKSRCSPGDPNVMVDTKAKTYKLDTAAKTPAMSGMSGSNSMSKTGDAAATSSDASGSAATLKSMCKSEAESMGAKMVSGAHKKSS